MRIAVWNTAFLGDAVLTLPLIAALKAAVPEGEVDFYVRPGLGALFSAQPELSAVYEQRKAGGLAGFVDLVRLGGKTAGRGYDVWVGCHQSPRSSFAALLSRAPVRVGYGGSLLRRLCYTRRTDRCFGELHEIDRLLRLAPAALGTTAEPDPAARPVRPDLALVPAARDAAEHFWNTHIRGPCLGVHPGSVWPTKCWTAEGFAHVVRAALDTGVDVIVFGGPGEEALAGHVCELARRNASSLSCGMLHDLSGRLNLPELAAFIDRLDAYLGNDSGPLHLAWSREVPVTALFGPTTESLGFFPRGEQATVLETSLSCRPCGLHGPRRCPLGHHRCMTDIEPETVWNDVRHKLFHL